MSRGARWRQPGARRREALHLDCQTRLNDPYTARWARCYDNLLSIPPWSLIRRSEEATLGSIFSAVLRPEDSVLEIGPGTGRYTVQLAQRVAAVTAVEHSPEMVSQLSRRLQREGIANCAVMEGEFVGTRLQSAFDVVAIIGVLDYVADPLAFMSKAAGLARREIVFTTPRCSFLAGLYQAGNRLRGIQVSTYTPDQIASYLPGFGLDISETGVCPPLWRGLTLACRATRL